MAEKQEITIGVGAIIEGASGRKSVMFKIDFPDGHGRLGYQVAVGQSFTIELTQDLHCDLAAQKEREHE